MATAAECATAVQSLVVRLQELEPELRSKYVVERTVSCRIPDLGVTYSGRLTDSGLVDVTTEDDARAQVRLTVDSNDLVALAVGRLQVPTAFAVGRLRVQANPLDLLKLRSLL